MQKQTLSLIVTCSLLAACGGGGGGSESDVAQSPMQDVTAPAGQSTDSQTTSDTTTPDTTTTPSGDPQAPDGASTATTSPSGGTTPPVVTPPPPPPPPVALSFFSFNTATSDLTSGTGELNETNDRITLGNVSGTISSDGTLVVLEGGGQIALPASDTTNVGLFQLETSAGDPSFGVYGRPTDFSSFTPDAGATYTGDGTVVVQIIDGTRIYDLNGDLTADVNFADNLVDIAISDLQGEETDGISTPEQVIDVATLNINGGQLTNGTFDGGTATFTSTEIATPLSGSEVVASTGALFGDTAQEIGGVFVVDDLSGAGSLLIRGQYVGD